MELSTFSSPCSSGGGVVNTLESKAVKSKALALQVLSVYILVIKEKTITQHVCDGDPSCAICRQIIFSSKAIHGSYLSYTAGTSQENGKNHLENVRGVLAASFWLINTLAI